MKVSLLNALKPHEWLSLAGGLLLLAATFALLIHPSLQSLADVPRLRQVIRAAQEELVEARAKLRRTEEEISQGRVLLAKMGGGPPPASQKDLQIARLTALADSCHVKINQCLPIDTVDHVDHRAFMVEFIGEGSFLDIQHLFGLIESTVDFVDVTNFAINVVKAGETSQCLVTWVCRINGVRPEMATTGLAVDKGNERSRPAEVARHER